MRRSQLEHAIRAATEVVAQDSVIVIGSQAILGSWSEEHLPRTVTMSFEVDICPMHDDDAESLATLLDGIAGELSPFHETHGFYIQGVGRRTAILPEGWVDRLVVVRNTNTNGRTGLCLEPHDLCTAKLLAGREKDHDFVEALLSAGLVDADTIGQRLRQTATEPQRVGRATAWLSAVSAGQSSTDHVSAPGLLPDPDEPR